MAAGLCISLVFLAVMPAHALLGEFGAAPDKLQSLASFREQHRKTIDGKLCAAAFVQDRKAYTGCSTSRNPAGEYGRAWCYIEPQASCHDCGGSLVCLGVVGENDGAQLASAASASSAWGFCGARPLPGGLCLC